MANCHKLLIKGFPGSSVGKGSACNAGDPSSIPGSGRSPGEGFDNPLQYFWVSLVAQFVKNLPTMQETQGWIKTKKILCHSSGGSKSEIKESVGYLQMLMGRILPCLFQLLVALDICWLYLDTSLCLCPHGAFSFSLYISHKDHLLMDLGPRVIAFGEHPLNYICEDCLYK